MTLAFTLAAFLALAGVCVYAWDDLFRALGEAL